MLIQLTTKLERESWISSKQALPSNSLQCSEAGHTYLIMIQCHQWYGDTGKVADFAHEEEDI